MKKVIIPVSGGIDSAYLISLALSQGHEPYLAVIDYEHNNNIEFIAALNICNHFGLPYVVLPIPHLDLLTVKYPWNFSSDNQRVAHEGGSPYWSGFKSLMYSVCLSYGGAIGADEIWWGVYEWNDHYVDELPESATKFRDVWATLYPELKTPTMAFPLMGHTKAEIIKQAHDLGTPLHLTWSCFHCGTDLYDTHCGVCPGCVHRRESFKAGGLKDPVSYKE